MRILIYIGIMLLFAYCQSSISKTARSNFKNLTTDSLLQAQLISDAISSQLPFIANGTNSFELRIRHGLTMAQPHQLLILKYEDSCWILTQIFYWSKGYDINENRMKFVTDSLISHTQLLSAGAFPTIEYISKFRLDSLPNQKDIPEFRDISADGRYYIVEIATPQFYKAISYHNPAFFTDQYNRQFQEFINKVMQLNAK